jgi:hypothetical protein
MIQHQGPVPMRHSLMNFHMPQKKYIGPWLSVCLAVVLCVPLASVELGTTKEINYTTFGSKTKTYSRPTWVRS